MQFKFTKLIIIVIYVFQATQDKDEPICWGVLNRNRCSYSVRTGTKNVPVYRLKENFLIHKCNRYFTFRE